METAQDTGTYTIYKFDGKSLPLDDKGKPDISQMKLIHKYFTDEQVNDFMEDVGESTDRTRSNYFVFNDTKNRPSFFYGLTESSPDDVESIEGNYGEMGIKFENDEQYFEFINEAFKKGQLREAKARFLRMSEEQKEDFFKYANGKDYADLFRFFHYAGKYGKGGFVQSIWSLLNERVSLKQIFTNEK